MANNLRAKIQYKKHIDSYLSSLTLLMGRYISEDELSTLDKVEEFRNMALPLSSMKKKVLSFDLSEIKGNCFQTMTSNLAQKNSSGVYLWYGLANYCGLFRADSLSEVKFDKIVEAVADEVIVFLTADFKDRLLLEADISTITVEAQGENWSAID